ncbi:chorismate-binding protein, partial [Alphaproteobacteria bacterium]|nr:chorismate-binding protein [Alphaproteobacteria bacterium]
MNNINSHSEFEPFVENFLKGKNQICYKVMLADTQTAVAAMLKLSEQSSYSCLLESVEGGTVRGRFSVIAIEPDLIWRCKGSVVDINRNPSEQPDNFISVESENPLQDLRSILAEGEMENTLPLAPMAAGLFGYFGYDMIRHVENIPDNNTDVLSHYDSVFIRPSIVAIFDRLEDTITLATQIRYQSKQAPETVWKNALKRIEATEDKLNSALTTNNVQNGKQKTSEHFDQVSANLSKSKFMEMVQAAKEYISKGDIFQVVLSQRFSIPFSLSPMSLYRSLRRLNPSPFLYCFHLKNVGIVGSSPEILVRLRDGEVTIRPVAGTRKRGATEEQDKQNAADLLA